MQNRTDITIEILLIRHGTTEYNQARRYLGWTDLPVSEQGMEELNALKQHAPSMYPAVTQVYASPMLRCRQTAEILYPGQEPVVIEDWKEMNFGVFEGRTADEMSDDAEYRAWVDSGCESPVPEGENRRDFTARNMAGLKSCLAMICKTNGIHKHLKETERWNTVMKPDRIVPFPSSDVKWNAYGQMDDGNIREIDCGRNGDRRNHGADSGNARIIRVAAIVHAGTIMSIVSSYLDKEYYDCYVKNGEGYRLIYTGDG